MPANHCVDRNADVDKRRFKVGQSVTYTPAGPPFIRGSSDYKVTHLVPSEDADAEFRYRIKGADEPHERVVRESELERLV
jgi:hypothetical protein